MSLTNEAIYSGKVRDVFKISDNTLLMRATNRISSFNKVIGEVPNKGKLINLMSAHWLSITKHIIPNHLLFYNDDYSIVESCIPFKIEVIVRGYMTGSTETSLWTHYNNGSRLYCGISLPDGLIKNQKLKEPIITPTTKGAIDVPISKEEIINEKYMTKEECIYIFEKALELFKFGENQANKAGLILVDTKYEFGKNKDNEILLIDELHTCDSSRFWLKSSYEECMAKQIEPKKLDKDCVRDWVKSKCDPYNDEIPNIPEEITNKAFENYNLFYNLIKDAYTKLENKYVVIIAGSIKDKLHVEKIESLLNEKSIKSKIYYSSAHRNTKDVLEIIENNENNENKKIVYITVAGKSNALSGVVAANSKFPTIACPYYKDGTDMLININSTLQCPAGVPVMTILDPNNVALCVEKILKY